MPLYAGPKSTSKSGMLAWRTEANASAVAERSLPSYRRPALKKYGDLLAVSVCAHSGARERGSEDPERREGRDGMSGWKTHRPDLRVNSPKRRTPVLMAVSMNLSLNSLDAILDVFAEKSDGEERLLDVERKTAEICRRVGLHLERWGCLTGSNAIKVLIIGFQLMS